MRLPSNPLVQGLNPVEPNFAAFHYLLRTLPPYSPTQPKPLTTGQAL